MLQHTTSVVEDSVNPEFNEEFTFSVSKEEIGEKVLKMTLFDTERGQKKVIGYCVVSLETERSDLELSVRELWLDVKENVTEEMKELLGDRLQLSLSYDPQPGRLSLGVLVCRVISLACHKDTGDRHINS